MHPYAQTNIQLFNQLHRSAGYGAADLESAVSSYQLAISLLTGRFRASGKTFIAHLVGTASILASLRVSAPMVVAGLLHAVYSAGDFGDGRTGVTDAKRERVRAVAGKRVEEYVSRYEALSWSDETIRTVSGGLESLAAIDRDVVLIRLANELEEFLDLGLRYGGEQKRLRTSATGRCRSMVAMAQRLGYTGLADELTKAIDESARATMQPELLTPHAPNASFLLAPQSYQRLKDSLASRLAARGEPARDRSK